MEMEEKNMYIITRMESNGEIFYVKKFGLLGIEFTKKLSDASMFRTRDAAEIALKRCAYDKTGLLVCNART